MQTAVVIILVALAVLYMANRFHRARKGSACCSDCAGCGCQSKTGEADVDNPAQSGQVLTPLVPHGPNAPSDHAIKGGCEACASRATTDSRN